MGHRGRLFVCVLALAAGLMTPAAVSAQPPTPFDPAAFKAGERLWVTTDVTHHGRLVEARADALVLDTADGPQTYLLSDIHRVHRRRNGVWLGTALGAGVGLAGGMGVAELLGNEGAGGGASAALLLTLLGAGGGYLLDAALGSYQVIYERPGTPRLDAVAHRVRASFELGPSVSRFAGVTESGATGGVSISVNLAGSPVWAGLTLVEVRARKAGIGGIGSVVQVDLGPRSRAAVPYASAGAVFGDWGAWGLAGGGVHVRMAQRVALKLGGQYTVRNHESVLVGQRTIGTSHDLGLQLGIVYR